MKKWIFSLLGGIAAIAAIPLFPLFLMFLQPAPLSCGSDCRTLEHRPVTIVFGASAPNGRVSDVFADRLTIAAQIYLADKTDIILVSGDGRDTEYNEPAAGSYYLQKLGVSSRDIWEDNAGLRTYDTCGRAAEQFGIDNAYLVTQSYHLPRAHYLCERWGIDSAGVHSDLRPYRQQEHMSTREIIAQIAGFWEALLWWHEPGEELPWTSLTENV